MNALKLPFTFDASIIKEEITQFSKTDYYDIYNPSVELETLWSKNLIEPIGGPDAPPKFLPNTALEQCSYLMSILNTFQCKKETFRIHALDPGAHIRPHRDIGYSLEHGKVRLHIPVQTNNQVEILLNNAPVKMQEGECWYCNFHITHEVHNHGDEPRIHLILDCMVNEWLEDIFRSIQ